MHVFMAFLTFFMFAYAAPPAMAQDEKACPDHGVVRVQVEHFNGNMFQSLTKSAFDIAREKSRRYNAKMPLRQGNNGFAKFRVETETDLVPYASNRCVAVKSVHVKVMIDHKVEIASEHEAGSCMFDELVGLESELMQQDELLIGTESRKMQQYLSAYFKELQGYPLKGADIDDVIAQKKQEIKDLVQGMVDKIALQAETLRRETDLPEYYDEIVADCSGG